MKQTTNLTEVQDILQQSSVAVIYLSMPNCSVCHAVRPRLEELLTHYDIPALHLDAFETPEVASKFEVLTAPVVLIFHQGKEVFRQARFIDFRSRFAIHSSNQHFGSIHLTEHSIEQR